MSISNNEYRISWDFSTEELSSIEQLMSYAKVLMWEAEEVILEEKLEKVTKSALKAFDPRFSFNVTVGEKDWEHRGAVEIVMTLNDVDPSAKNTASLGLARRRIINKFSSLKKSGDKL